MEAMSLQEAVKLPVAVLKVGESRHVRLDIEFPDAPVTFTLVQVINNIASHTVNDIIIILLCIKSFHCASFMMIKQTIVLCDRHATSF